MSLRMKVRSRSMMLALGGVIVLAAALILIGRTGGGRPSDRTGETGPPGEAAGSGDASRARRLAEMREGRFEEAFSWYARPGRDGPGPEDLYTLGTALLARDHLVLGWAALEASRRIDRGHAATDRALSELENKLYVATGPARVGGAGVAGTIEKLRSIRGGPALGLLAMGLARYGDDPGREQDFLDRLSIRDRSELRAVEGPAAAVKLVSRLLMESGRGAEASDLLRPMTDGSAADREAAWLLSRAALQLGQLDQADAMLELAAGFGGDGLSPEPSPFVGSRKCAECHPSAYRAAQQSSPHARTISYGASLKDVPLPDHPVPDPLDPQVRHTFTREADDRIRLETTDSRGRVARAVVAYALGSGEHGITMLSRDDPGGTPRQLRISYYADGRPWRETKGVNVVPHDPEQFIGLGLSDKALRQCLHCHTTWFRIAMPDDRVPPGPEVHDRGIGCERCHGPGLNHVRAAETGYGETAIAATRGSPPRRLMKSCEECHGSNGLVEPSDPEFTRFQGTTLKFSRCFTGSDGAIHCATCHDPHRGLDTTASHYDAKCLGCHAAPTASARGRVGGAACPVNPSSGCIACHMPKVQDPGFQTRFTDHHIRVHREGPGGGRGTTGGERR